MPPSATPAGQILDWIIDQPEAFQLAVAQYTLGLAKESASFEDQGLGPLEPVGRLVRDPRQDPAIAVGLALHLRSVVEFCIWSHGQREMSLADSVARVGATTKLALVIGGQAVERVDEWARLARSWELVASQEASDGALDAWLSAQ